MYSVNLGVQIRKSAIIIRIVAIIAKEGITVPV